jgi:hypothetical protein
VWATADGKFFGWVGGLAILPVGYEDELRREQIAFRSPLCPGQRQLIFASRVPDRRDAERQQKRPRGIIAEMLV